MTLRHACTAALVAGLLLAHPGRAKADAPQRVRALSAADTAIVLPDGSRATVSDDGVARIKSLNGRQVEFRRVALEPRGLPMQRMGLPTRGQLMAALAEGVRQPYAPGAVLVIYRDGISAVRDVENVPANVVAALRSDASRSASFEVPAYTGDAATNRALARLGVDSSERLFSAFDRSRLVALRRGAASAGGAPLLDFTNAYRLHVAGATVPNAVRALAKLPSVAYVAPDWSVDAVHPTAIPVAPSIAAQAANRAQSLERRGTQTMRASAVPANYMLRSSGQSMLNAPGDDMAAAYDEIEHAFRQLPGQGEIVTNVSIGDLDDQAASKTSNPCNYWVSNYGPTTELIEGRRYLNLPSMPLIPTYTADRRGALDAGGQVCGVDPFLGEVDLDFAMMAPLPNALQRPNERGRGLTDLIGIAPGAQYRLVVPADAAATISDIQGALIGAALQTPHPNVITASLGYGYDASGFPSRYLEDDPMTEAIVASIVRSQHIVVCIAGGDGMRTFTTVDVGPSGGSAPTDVAAPGSTPSALSDVADSTVPSLDFDSGAIAVGGTTLDDIFSNPPQYLAAGSAAQAQHAYAETRWNGFTLFSSAYGSRIDLSAPSDNLVAFQHTQGGADDAVDLVLQGGTSASAPAVAAAAAVVQQVARLSGTPLDDPLAMRAFLKQNATTVPSPPQADRSLHVGPQLDVRRAVEALLARSGKHGTPSVARVAIEQRRGILAGDTLFLSDTDPNEIDLQSTACAPSCAFQATDELAWLTIAPDWEFLPAGATYALKVGGKAKVLATTPWARLQPETILNAAGLPLVSPSKRTIALTYAATAGGKTLSTSFSITFGPAPARTDEVHAAHVPSLVRGATIPVDYDLTHAAHVARPQLLVTEPGRFPPTIGGSYSGTVWHPSYTMTLPNLKGTVNVPVANLHGGGVYGIFVYLNPGTVSQFGEYDSDTAYTRVAGSQESDVRPPAPLLSYDGSVPGHGLEIPYGASFGVTYDVRNVPRANGAELEVSAGGAGLYSIFNPFNNPNGSIEDHDGVDHGSVYFAPLSGTSGTVTLDGNAIGLDPSLIHVVRVIPTAGGVAAGEASDVSAISMDGVVPAHGGALQFGYGLNTNGLDGFLTSAVFGAGGVHFSSLELFDQTSESVTQTIASTGGNQWYSTVPEMAAGDGWGTYAGDLGLFETYDGTSGTATYNLLAPVAGGAVGAAWTPPMKIWSNAVNAANDTAVLVAQDTTAQPNDQWRLFTSDVARNTFTAPVDISAPLRAFGSPTVYGVAVDTATQTAVVLGEDASNTFAKPVLVTVDLKTGAVGSIEGLGCGANGIALDSVTGNVAVPSDACATGNTITLGIYNLATRHGFTVPLPANYFDETADMVSADDRNHEFLIGQPSGPDESVDNNQLSRVLVYDEQGNLKKTIPRFDLFNFFVNPGAGNIQLKEPLHKAYIWGQFDAQLEPFSY